MKVPPASTKRSRMANDVASSVRVPMNIVPRQMVETSNAVRPSPMVRVRMVSSRSGLWCASSVGTDRLGHTLQSVPSRPDQSEGDGCHDTIRRARRSPGRRSSTSAMRRSPCATGSSPRSARPCTPDASRPAPRSRRAVPSPRRSECPVGWSPRCTGSSSPKACSRRESGRRRACPIGSGPPVAPPRMPCRGPSVVASTVRHSTSAPACPTCGTFRGHAGRTRCATRSPRCPTPSSRSSIGWGIRSPAPLWPPISRAPVVRSQHPTTS